MLARKTLLKIMLWSLGVAALLGAGAILMGETTGIWRVSLTALVTAGASGLMMPASLLMDRKQGRAAGTLGMLTVLALFFLSLILVWDLVQIFPGSHLEGRIGLTIAFVILCAPFAIFFLTLMHKPAALVAGWFGVLAAAMTFLLFMVGTWLEDRPFLSEEWGWTGTAVGVYGLLGVICLIGIDPKTNPPGRRWMVMVRGVGTAAALLAMTIVIYAIWMDIHSDTGLFTTLTSIAAVVAHANLCLLAPLVGGQVWVRHITIASAAVTAASIDAIFIFDLWYGGDEVFVRLASAAGFVASCGSLALLVLARINRRASDEPPVLAEIRAVTLICPGCDKKQTLPVGRTACPTCRLEFELRVHEPRCPNCDYLLYRLTSDRCPECGMELGRSAPAPAL